MEKYKGGLFILLLSGIVATVVMMPVSTDGGVGRNRGFSMFKRIVDSVVGGNVDLAVGIIVALGLLGAAMVWPRSRR